MLVAVGIALALAAGGVAVVALEAEQEEGRRIEGPQPVALVDEAPPTAQRDALWLQLVLVAAGFWSWSELDPDRQWNLAVPTGGPSSLHVWFTNRAREPEGQVRDPHGVRASWGAQGLTLWAEPVGDWDIRRADLERLVRASLRVPRR